jgi:Membrane protein involved in colicin uptake
MFKYVESMRKAAFRIMSKTYGAKKKDSGEGIYDEYPLKDLVHLLCFEDEEEARNACKHYNITVKKLPLEKSSHGHVEIIFWRKSYFLEPRDPAKGVLVHLKPKKMNRVIEKKLSGATRLAICRGEVSGIGATVEKSSAPETSQLSKTVKTEKECLEVVSNAVEIVAVKEKIEERQVLPPLVSLVSLQSKVQDDTHRKGKSEFQLSYAKQIENNFVKHWDTKDIKLRRKEEAIVLQTDEEHRLKPVQSEKQLELDRRRKEEALQEKVREEAEEKHRIQEIHHQELIAIQKQQEEVERQKRARQAEQRRIELEWQTKIAYAKKLLAWNKLITRFRVKHLVRMETHSQIESFNPLHRIDSDLFLVEQYLTGSHLKESTQVKELRPQGNSIETIFYRLATDNTSPLALHDILFNELLSKWMLSRDEQSKIWEWRF